MKRYFIIENDISIFEINSLQQSLLSQKPMRLDVHPCAPQPSLDKDQQCQFYLGDGYTFCRVSAHAITLVRR